jgi:phosphoglycolate phosphatase
MKPCIAFDFDGTIVDTRPVIAEFYNSFLSKTYGGNKISLQQIELLKTLSLREKIHYLKIPPLKIPFLVRAARKEINLRIESLPIYDGIVEVLQHLKNKGFTIAVLSSNKADTIKHFFACRAINCVDYVYCDRGLSLFVKSHTIHRFLKKKGIPREEFVYIGDEVRDIEACRKQQVKIISVLWGWDSPEVLQRAQPDFIAQKPQDILLHVETLFMQKVST